MFGPQKQSNKIVTVPAPVTGLNARDSLATMQQTDAVYLNNWWPQPYGVSVRKGYEEWVTGLPDTVDTLATLVEPDGTETLYAWSEGSVFDVTTQGVAGPAGISGLEGSLASRWQNTTMVNDSGSHMIAVNGQVDAILFEAVGVITRITAGDGTGSTWAGLDPKKAIQVTVHQGRLWATEVDSTRGWYFDVGAIFGTAVSFDFGPQFAKGGHLAFLSTWTIDDGNGAEDHLVAVSSMGEAVVYGGTDPSNDQSWSQVGVYFVGAPLNGRRAYTKIGSDLAILTQRGVISMANMLSSTKVNESATAVTTDKIQYLMSRYAIQFIDTYGWSLNYFPANNMLLFNVPSNPGDENFQVVSNQVSSVQPWATFTGMDAICWEQFQNFPMFGGKLGVVYRAWVGTEDKVRINTDTGISIIATAQQAYTSFGADGTQKQVDLFRPNFMVASKIAYTTQVLYDYATPAPVDVIAPLNAYPHRRKVTPSPFATEAVWDAGKWDDSLWNARDSTPGLPDAQEPALAQREWSQSNGMGVAASLKITVNTSFAVLWVSTDYSIRNGGLL